MNNLSPKIIKIINFSGLFCFSIPVIIFGLWIHAFNLGTVQSERVEIYLSYFPEWLHGRYDLAYLSIAFCALTFILSCIGFTISGITWKVINIIFLVSSILLLLLNFFQML
jgi:hypothetical protein